MRGHMPEQCCRHLPVLIGAHGPTEPNSSGLWIIFAFSSPTLILMFPGPESSKLVVVECKGCHENIPAPVEGMPAQPIATRCPLCHEHRRYLPSEVFLGRLSHLMIRKPVRTADGRPR